MTNEAKYFYNMNMKKRNKMKYLVVALLCMMSAFVFVGCGTKGSSDVQGVFFVKDVYYVDYNVETFLEYKVYPATSSNYAVNLALGRNYVTESKYFDFNNGTVRVKDKAFSTIKVNVGINEFQDSCEVRLREYPRKISFAEKTTKVQAGRVLTLEIDGVFDSGDRKCNPDEFNYLITSSDPSVVEIVDSANLVVASTGKSGESDIRVEILNSLGESQNLVATTKLVCRNNVADTFVIFGETVIKNNAQLNIATEKDVSFDVQVFYFDKNDFLISDADFDILLSNNDVFDVVEDKDGKHLVVKEQKDNEVFEYEVKVTLYSNEDNTSGLPTKVVFNIKVTYPHAEETS